MIAVYLAMEEESIDFKKNLTIKKTIEHEFSRVYECEYFNRDFILVLTGVGKELSQKAVENSLGKYPVTLVISTGFGGALNDKTAVGDIVVCSQLNCGYDLNDVHDANTEIDSAPELIELAARLSLPDDFKIILGKGISYNQLCSTPEMKRRLGEKTGADMVDMESYWIGQFSSIRHIPFLAVRVISDSVDDDLSIFEGVSQTGKSIPLKVLREFMADPEKVKKLQYHTDNNRKASRNLATYMFRLLDTILNNKSFVNYQ